MSVRFSLYNSFETSNVHDTKKYKHAFGILNFLDVKVSADFPLDTSEVLFWFWCRNLREEEHLEDPDIDGRIILRWTFEKLGGGHGRN